MSSLPDFTQAAVTTDHLAEFNNSLSLDNAIADSYLTALPNYCFLLLAGPDALTFIQGQVTCDVTEVTTQHVRPGAHCSHKGRIIGNFVAIQLAADTYLLQTPTDNAQHLLASLRKYIVFSKAAIDIASDWLCIGVSGNDSQQLISDYFDGVPTNRYDLVSQHKAHCYQLGGNRYVVCCHSSEFEPLWQHFRQQLAVADTVIWLAENCRAGLADIVSTSKECFIPQAINLPEVGGVSFTKGCYTGQEIVARMKYLGKQKRHMAYFTMAGAKPAVASQVFIQENLKSCGEIVQAIQLDVTSAVGLVVIADDAFDQTIVDASHQQTLTITPINLKRSVSSRG